MVDLSLDVNPKPNKSQTRDLTYADDVGSEWRFSVRKSAAIIFVSSLALWAVPVVFWLLM